MVIRDYRSSDAAAVTGLIVQMQDYERTIDIRSLRGTAVEDWYLDLILAACGKTDGALLVAVWDGSIVGFAAVQARVLCEDVDEEDYHYALVSELAVDEAHRGRGIGRALIAASEAYARDKGARWLRITVLGTQCTRPRPLRGLRLRGAAAGDGNAVAGQVSQARRGN